MHYKYYKHVLKNSINILYTCVLNFPRNEQSNLRSKCNFSGLGKIYFSQNRSVLSCGITFLPNLRAYLINFEI